MWSPIKSPNDRQLDNMSHVAAFRHLELRIDFAYTVAALAFIGMIVALVIAIVK